ncbi:serine/threonine-protein kinase EDR1-like [Arachis stenosperma]|uniref:serine/threonine-protein kinase EDR1-like n=1 Tax=Arachis stenosperma TaxID=217475 RepID=UPI0025ABD37E|nr:serine/threonine-protein kinase EDR1-like [Arachis stenosperma]
MGRNRMKNLFRKLHIGGGDGGDDGDGDGGASPTMNELPSRNLSVAEHEREHEFQFQMRMALAISASHPIPNNDADSDQIDAAKQMSLGSESSLTQFQSLRYWNYSVIGYEEKVMDEFYDVYGISSNFIRRGKMPLLVDLQAKTTSQNGDREVILVNRLVDLELQRLEEKACALFNDCPISEKGLILSGLLQRLADIVVTRMGGTVGSADKMIERWARRSHELRDSSRTIVLPLGSLDVGLSRHRALLFKVLADKINIPCMLVKGSYYTGTDDGALNLIKADDGSEYIIDMMGAPGVLIPAEVPSSQLQKYSFSVRNCEEVVRVGLSNRTHLIDTRTQVLGSSPDQCSKKTKAVRSQSEKPLNVGGQTKLVDNIHVGMNERERFGHNLGNLLESLHKSCEFSSHRETSPAEKIRVNNVSKYVLSAAKNPEFAQKLHTVLLESGALPPHDLFSVVNPQDMGEDKTCEEFVRDIVQDDPTRLSLSYNKSLIPYQMKCTAHDTRSEQQKEFYVDRYDNSTQCDCECDKTGKGSVMVCDNRVDGLEQSHYLCKEQCLQSDLPKRAVSCETRDRFDVSHDGDDKNGYNEVGVALNDVGFCKESAIQINKAPCIESAKCITYDHKNDRVNPVLGERKEWEIQWEDLRIGQRIGIGSCGEVFHADCNGSEVAVKKFLTQDFSSDAVAQFKSEVEIMLRLRHPNIVLFMGAITRPPHLSILTEFLPRGSLYGLLRNPKFQLNDKRRLRMAVDVAKGMNYLHTSHPPIVHRDLKSPNLLVSKHWVLKVCDFGLSRMKHHTFLSSKSYAGTAEWMAPEVLRNELANEKCDIYSFGVILWELATTMIPWQGLNQMQVVGAVGFQNRRLEIPDDVDPEVEQIIRDCWQMDPQLRPSFSELLSRLCQLQHLVVVKGVKRAPHIK